MFALPLILAAGSLSTLISGAPVPSFLSGSAADVASPRSLEERSANAYLTYGGSGEVSDGWPAQSAWVSTFDAMFESNKVIMSSSCTQWDVANDSNDEIANLKTSIQSVATSTGIDARFILAIIMQESNGCVRAPTTNYGVRNPGLMQSHNGAGTCNDGSVSNPCPASELTQMIQDGTAGTSSGDGLKQCIAESGATDVSMYYKAARIYNSGSIDSTKNLGAGIATHCYASDVANRLTGWTTAASTCNSNTVSALTTTAGSIASSDNTGASVTIPDTSASSTTEAAQAPSPTTSSVVVVAAPSPTTVTPVVVAPEQEPASSTSTAVAAPTPTPATQTTTSPAKLSNTDTSTAEIYPYAISPCQEYYTVVEGDYCILVEDKFGITASQLISWNTGLDTACSNLWLGYQYCVKA